MNPGCSSACRGIVSVFQVCVMRDKSKDDGLITYSLQFQFSLTASICLCFQSSSDSSPQLLHVHFSLEFAVRSARDLGRGEK